MRIVKWALIASFVAPILLGATTFGVDGESYPEVCNPQPRSVGPIHISYINCVAEADEVVIVLNATNRPVDMTGYALTNASRGLTFVFERTPTNAGCCTLGPNEAFRIHTGLRNLERFDGPYDLHWLREPGQPEPERIWDDSGDVAKLLNPQGEVVDTYAYGQP